MIDSRIVPSTDMSYLPIGGTDRLAENRRLDSEEGFHVEMSGFLVHFELSKCCLPTNKLNRYLQHKCHLHLPERKIKTSTEY